jgi:hypothetical protein
MALPDFLIIGAMKCGTTTLQAQLAQVPGVFMTTPKEPNFFSDDDVWEKGRGWYEALFEDAGPQDLKGEASTHYTKLPTHPRTLERLRPMLPSPRIIYMIRNPFDRAVSHYIHAWSMGEAGGDAVAAFAETPAYADYGHYGMQIAPWVEAYGTDRILLTSLEQLTASPDAEFRRIQAFLGLAAVRDWDGALAPQNVSAERVRPLPLQAVLVDNMVARGLRRALVPKRVRTWVRERRQMQQRPTLPVALRRQLEANFLADRETLARQFPGHPALTLCYPFVPA